MEVEARSATTDDLEVIVALCAAAVEELKPNRGGAIWSRREARTEPYDASIGATLDDPDAALAVGTIDGTVVAYAAVHAEPLHDGALIGDLTDIYVLDGARAVGVGEALMQHVTAWCEARGCVGIDSIALPGDRHTKNFFETFGLVARALRVHRPL